MIPEVQDLRQSITERFCVLLLENTGENPHAGNIHEQESNRGY